MERRRGKDDDDVAKGVHTPSSLGTGFPAIMEHYVIDGFAIHGAERVRSAELLT